MKRSSYSKSMNRAYQMIGSINMQIIWYNQEEAYGVM